MEQFFEGLLGLLGLAGLGPQLRCGTPRRIRLRRGFGGLSQEQIGFLERMRGVRAFVAKGGASRIADGALRRDVARRGVCPSARCVWSSTRVEEAPSS